LTSTSGERSASCSPGVDPAAIAALHALAATPATADNVVVSVSLTGGHSVALALTRQDPVLGSLLAAVLDRALGRRPKGVLRLPVTAARELTVAAADVIAVTTEPAVGLADLVPADGPDGDGVVPADFRLFHQVLSDDEHRRFLTYVERHERDFRDTDASGHAPRRSLVLQHFPSFERLVGSRARGYLPEVVDYFGLDAVPGGPIDLLLSAHGDGDVLGPHHDNGYPDGDVDRRELTFVYYFHRRPKRFEGGQLRLYDWQRIGGALVPASSFADVEPADNTMVFFPSRTRHELLPVSSPSGQFADRRYAVSGFVRRPAR
jgi:SM-20-related protein